ncbi:MAG: NUDIX domain-containing protein [Caldilineaceae bacterium]
MPKRPTYRAAVYVIPVRGREILLSQRFNTGFGDGWYSFVAGHVEEGESSTQTAVRESLEEAGIGIVQSDLRYVHTLHRFTDDGLVYFDLFFTVESWQGTPSVMEPHRCSEMRWAAFDALPEKTLPYIRHVVAQVFVARNPFSEFGW